MAQRFPAAQCLYLITWLSLLVAVPAFPDDMPQLLPVPHPDTARLEPAAADIVSRAIQVYERESRSTTGQASGVINGRLGMVYQAWQFQEAAYAAYHNAVLLAPEEMRWPYYLAVYYEEAGDFDNAIAGYRRSLEIEADYLNAWLRLGEVLVEAGRLEQADEAFIRALAIEPEQVVAIAGRGTVAMQLEDYERSIDFFLEALELQSEASQLHYRLGQAYRHVGDIETAQVHLAQAGKRIPSAPDPLLELMKARTRPASYYVVSGRGEAGKGNYQRAVTAYRIALDIDPYYVDAYIGAAKIYVELERPAQARQLILKALAIAPDDAGVLSLQEQLGRTE